MRPSWTVARQTVSMKRQDYSTHSLGLYLQLTIISKCRTHHISSQARQTGTQTAKEPHEEAPSSLLWRPNQPWASQDVFSRQVSRYLSALWAVASLHQPVPPEVEALLSKLRDRAIISTHKRSNGNLAGRFCWDELDLCLKITAPRYFTS